MKHIKVKWIHSSQDDPVLLYSELTDDMWEIRKVEIYPDGRMDFAGREAQSGSTQIGTEPYPSLEEIAADPQFEPEMISIEEFEFAWARAFRA